MDNSMTKLMTNLVDQTFSSNRFAVFSLKNRRSANGLDCRSMQSIKPEQINKPINHWLEDLLSMSSPKKKLLTMLFCSLF